MKKTAFLASIVFVFRRSAWAPAFNIEGAPRAGLSWERDGEYDEP
jgi:hypothetical protein